MIDDWLSSIDHAGMAEWVTVAAYLLAALLSAHAARHAWLRRETGETLFWRLAAALLVLLGVNELLDLQTLLTIAGRAHAKAHGWYGQQRGVQYAFVIALAAVAVLAGIVMLWLTRRMHGAVRLALAGFVFIGLFVLLRAAAFNHLDDLLGRGMAAFGRGSFQELAGILIVAGAAVLYTRGRRTRR